MRQLPAAELLVQMPFLQKLLQRLLDCKPTGSASHDAVVQVPTKTGGLGLGVSKGHRGGGRRHILVKWWIGRRCLALGMLLLCSS